MKFSTMLKHPTAYLPILMSLAACALVVGHIVVYGMQDRGGSDEGTAAHLFQLLLAGQLPIVAFFAIRWLPKAPRAALVVLALQAAAGLAALVPLYILEH